MHMRYYMYRAGGAGVAGWCGVLGQLVGDRPQAIPVEQVYSNITIRTGGYASYAMVMHVLISSKTP